jgi:Dyp-type peroxidase family
VFGYPAQNPNDPVRAGVPVDAGPAWADDGSFLVFRRLNQDYAAFWAFLADEATRLGMTPEAVGALVVGRWRSGAPVIRTARSRPAGPGRDDPDLGRDREASNDFDFSGAPARGHAYENGQDPLGLACPASAHIRKVNPRAGYTDQGGQEDTLTRLILRRGIPFGPLFVDAPRQERGLHFLCYQTSIVDQFEFLTRVWSNSPVAPRGGGIDLAVGQHEDPSRTAFLARPGGARATVPVTAGLPFVVATGGEYLFAPSKDGLRHIAGPAPA